MKYKLVDHFSTAVAVEYYVFRDEQENKIVFSIHEKFTRLTTYDADRARHYYKVPIKLPITEDNVQYCIDRIMKLVILK